jgi:hypothetical protein
MHARSRRFDLNAREASTMIRRRLFSAEHESFRASFRKSMEREVIPHHEAWEERG